MLANAPSGWTAPGEAPVATRPNMAVDKPAGAMAWHMPRKKIIIRLGNMAKAQTDY